MANQNAKIDENRGTTGLAMTSDNIDIRNILIDPIFGNLLIDIAGVVDTSTVESKTATKKIDENREGVAIGVTDDTNKTISPFLLTSDGYLKVDLIIV